MFGYVVAERSSLTEEALNRYRECYCGLCRSIGQQFGALQRAALNYDMTFLILLLSSLYEPEEQQHSCFCIMHPRKPCTSWQSEITQYAAAMNVALAYHNCMDDWHDDRKLNARLLAGLFRTGASVAQNQYPRQWQAMEQCMVRLSEIEAADLQEPDQGSAAFGDLMAELFVWKEDRWSPLLRQMGSCLGRYIYLLDALLDLPEDVSSNSYNPFRDRYQKGLNKTDYLPVLKMLMGECTNAMEQLPLVQDLALLRNILYAGVWTGYYRSNKQADKEEKHV